MLIREGEILLKIIYVINKMLIRKEELYEKKRRVRKVVGSSWYG